MFIVDGRLIVTALVIIVLLIAAIYFIIRINNRTREEVSRYTTDLRDLMEVFSEVAFSLTGTPMTQKPQWSPPQLVGYINDYLKDHKPSYGDARWPKNLIINLRNRLEQIQEVWKLLAKLDTASRAGEAAVCPDEFEKIDQFITELNVTYGFFGTAKDHVDEMIRSCARGWQKQQLLAAAKHDQEAERCRYVARECESRYLSDQVVEEDRPSALEFVHGVGNPVST